MPNRSSDIDREIPGAATISAATAPSTNLTPGADNQGADALIHYINVQAGVAASSATLFESDDNITFTACPAGAVIPDTSDGTAVVSLLVTGQVRRLAYVGNKRYSVVRIVAGTATVTTFAQPGYINVSNRARAL